MNKDKTIKLPIRRVDKPIDLPRKMTPVQVYTTIVEWLYMSDGEFRSNNEWRRSLLRHMQHLFKRM